MKVAISGPPKTLKSKLCSQLVRDEWARSIFNIVNPTVKANLNIDEIDSILVKSKSIQLLINEHISSIYNNNNCIYDTSLLDVLAKTLEYTAQDIVLDNTFNMYFSSIVPSLALYDRLFLIVNKDSDKWEYYDSAYSICSSNNATKKIELIEEVDYNTLLADIKQTYKENIERNEENSSNWISKHREDYFSSGTSQTSSV